MKPNSALITHLSGETTSFATCWKITLASGTLFTFTDHDADIIVEGRTYLARTGYTASAIQSSAAFNVDQNEVSGLLDSVQIREQDVLSGLWDYAQVEIFIVNWASPTDGVLRQRVGWLGEVSIDGDQRFRAELRGLMQAFTRHIGSLVAPSCDAEFGDARCGISLAAHTYAATVTSIDANNRIIGATALSQAAGFFDQGKVTFTSGANVGLIMEIKASLPASLELQQPLGFPILVGDTFDATRGCAKRFVEDCKTIYNNAVRFRGFPHLPGLDKMMRPGGV